MGTRGTDYRSSYEEAFAVNVRAPYFPAAARAPTKLAEGKGSIISSLATKIAMPGMSIYGATKSALEGPTRR